MPKSLMVLNPADTAACCPPLSSEPLSAEQAEQVAPLLKALADPVRLRLMSLVASHPGGEACVCGLTDAFDLSQPTISHHLKVLHDCGLLDREKRSVWVYYRPRPQALASLGALIGYPPSDQAHRGQQATGRVPAREEGMTSMTKPDELEEVRARVRARYARAAAVVTEGGIATCADSCGGEDEIGTGAELYSGAEQDELPKQAAAASLGCGNPLAIADLKDGETVLDLGSGGGIDVLLSAGRVGPAGKAYGLDMTDEMLDLARASAAQAGTANVEFLQGHIEDIPLPGNSVDVIISNCVINLSGNKPAVLAESFRVLRPGGRFGVSDILAENHLTEAERAERGSHVGCIAGAMSFAEYEDGLARAGFTGVSIIPTHQGSAVAAPADVTQLGLSETGDGSCGPAGCC